MSGNSRTPQTTFRFVWPIPEVAIYPSLGCLKLIFWFKATKNHRLKPLVLKEMSSCHFTPAIKTLKLNGFPFVHISCPNCHWFHPWPGGVSQWQCDSLGEVGIRSASDLKTRLRTNQIAPGSFPVMMEWQETNKNQRITALPPRCSCYCPILPYLIGQEYKGSSCIDQSTRLSHSITVERSVHRDWYATGVSVGRIHPCLRWPTICVSKTLEGRKNWNKYIHIPSILTAIE